MGVRPWTRCRLHRCGGQLAGDATCVEPGRKRATGDAALHPEQSQPISSLRAALADAGKPMRPLHRVNCSAPRQRLVPARQSMGPVEKAFVASRRHQRPATVCFGIAMACWCLTVGQDGRYATWPRPGKRPTFTLLKRWPAGPPVRIRRQIRAWWRPGRIKISFGIPASVASVSWRSRTIRRWRWCWFHSPPAWRCRGWYLACTIRVMCWRHSVSARRWRGCRCGWCRA